LQLCTVVDRFRVIFRASLTFRRTMQRFLTKLTPEQAEQQRLRIADELATANAAAATAAAARPPARGPGRPRSAASGVTTLSAACTASSSDDENDTADTGENASSRKRPYTSWLASDDFHIIHDAVRRRQSFRGAVRELQQRFPRLPTQQHGKFELLHASTLRHWYARDSTRAVKLKSEYERFLGPQFDQQRVAGGGGPSSWWEQHPEATHSIIAALKVLRDEDRAAIAVGLRLLRWTVAAIAKQHGVADPPLSNGSLSHFAHQFMKWSWRCRTTAAAKLPADWQRQGEQMATRIAVHIEFSKVDPSLIVNWDQTGVILIPASSRTYERQGESRVAVLGAEEKRQITAVLASSMEGDMLPLQLIFAGKTERSRPPPTLASIAAGFHLTSSENHWSTQQTMQEYILNVIEPYRQRKIKDKALPLDSRMILVLDAWSVHRSAEFRSWMVKNHPLMHLVFVPANCTSHLQVADVALQKPFKSKIRDRFSEWAATIITEQASKGEISGLRAYLGLKELRPLLLEWALHAWNHLASPAGKEMILKGWFQCVHGHYNVLDPESRKKAVEAAAKGEIKAYDFVPAADEPDKLAEDVWEGDSDIEDDELDLTKLKAEGERKSKRAKLDRQPDIGSYMLDSSQIELSDDDDD
jgi:hypothetical protein